MEFKKKSIFIVIIFLFQGFIFFNLNCMPSEFPKMVVTVPIAGLMVVPRLARTNSDEHLMQVSHLLYGDIVELLETVDRDGDCWLKVRVIEQKTCDSSGFLQAIEGFITQDQVKSIDEAAAYNLVVRFLKTPVFSSLDKDGEILFEVCIGTKFLGCMSKNTYWYLVCLNGGGYGYVHAYDVNSLPITIREENRRREVAKTAQLFDCNPWYYWQERELIPKAKFQTISDSFFHFLYLIYKANGIDVPISGSALFRCCRQIAYGCQMQPGDLIFIADVKASKVINNVLIYVGGNKVVEFGENEDLFKVRKAYVFSWIGSDDIKKVASGSMYNGKIVYFGSFF